MRVLGAVEFDPGQSIAERIKDVSTRVFSDEASQTFQFTWRTIQTWYSRYQKDGVLSAAKHGSAGAREFGVGTRLLRGMGAEASVWRARGRLVLEA
jgi:hypothetical protein